MEKLYIAYAVFAAVIFVLGIFEALLPVQVINVQKRIYANMNWILTPIDMDKEVSHTRVAGLLMIGMAGFTGAIVVAFASGWLA